MQLWVYATDLLAPFHEDDNNNNDGNVMGQARPTSIFEEPAQRLLLIPLRRERRKGRGGGEVNGGRGGRGDDGAPPARREDDDDDNDGNKDNDDLSRDRRQAEGGEGDIDDGVDDEHIDGCVQGPRLADTGNGQRQGLRHDGNNNNDVKEGGLHPTTPQTTVTHELAERLCSAGHDWQRAEGGECDVDDGGDN